MPTILRPMRMDEEVGVLVAKMEAANGTRRPLTTTDRVFLDAFTPASAWTDWPALEEVDDAAR